MVPPKSSPNELALTITRYRKSKLSSLAEKFTRRSPSLGGPRFAPPFSSCARQFTEVILIFRTRETRACVHEPITHACACEYARYARAKSADMERTDEVSENYTLLSYSPRCIRAYPLSILGQVFTLAFREQPSYVCCRTSDFGDRSSAKKSVESILRK